MIIKQSRYDVYIKEYTIEYCLIIVIVMLWDRLSLVERLTLRKRGLVIVLAFLGMISADASAYPACPTLTLSEYAFDLSSLSDVNITYDAPNNGPTIRFTPCDPSSCNGFLSATMGTPPVCQPYTCTMLIIETHKHCQTIISYSIRNSLRSDSSSATFLSQSRPPTRTTA